MLTKQERAEIAARLISYDGCILTWTNLYECLLDAPITGDVSLEEDSKYVLDCLVDLCDTSNMVELPVDKDGEVIHIGDTVYDCECTKYEVAGHSSSSNVLLSAGRELICFKKPANELTHKEPVTVKLLAQHIKRVLGDEATSIGVVPYIELRRIAKQLESLGDSDDD
jgi:hypothetical protein